MFGGSNEPFNSNQVIKCDRIDEKTQGMEISVKNDITEQPFLKTNINDHNINFKNILNHLALKVQPLSLLKNYHIFWNVLLSRKKNLK